MMTTCVSGRHLISSCCAAAIALFGALGCDDQAVAPGPDTPAATSETKPTSSDDPKAEPTATPSTTAETTPSAETIPSAEASATVAAPSNKPTTAKGNPTPVTQKKPTGPEAGKQWTTVASVSAEKGYKCNDAYPHKFIASGGSNVDYPSPKTAGGCAGTKAISVSVPYIPKASGPGAVAGTLKYGICDEAKTNCRIVKKAMTLPFTAK